MGNGARSRLRRLVVTTALLSGVMGGGWAGAAAPALAQDRQVTFQIAPQTLQGALIEYGRVTNRQIIFSSDDLRGRQSAGLRGPHEPVAALDLILAGSGLTWRRTPTGAIQVEAGKPARPQAAAAAANADDVSVISEVVVTGSRLAGGKNDLNPVNTYSNETVARSGQTTLTGFLNSLPEVSVGSSGNGFLFGGQTTVRLRGLPTGTTLVLLDGRRLASSGVGGASAVVDLNAFTPDLLDRVDIVSTGSSAIYGSDAIGGVVNLISRKRFSGIGGSISHVVADDYSQTQAAIGIGKAFSRGSISLIASYREQDSLQASDRAATADSDLRRFAALGGRDQRQQFCDPGTVFAASGNLNGLGVSSAGVPAGSQPGLAIPDFMATRGVANVCNYYTRYNLIPKIEGASAVLSGEFELADNIDIYSDIFYSKYDTDNRFRGYLVSRLAVPASNAFNPFGQAVSVTTLFPVFDGNETHGEIFRPLIGFRGSLWDGWSWDAAVWRNATKDRLTQIVRNTSILNAALASSDPVTALNVFRPATNSATLLDGVFTRPVSDYRTWQTGADAVLRGRLIELPAGPLAAALGWEGGREKVERTVVGATGPVRTSGRRKTQSVFLETRVPLLKGAAGGGPMLQADLAGRYDHYSDFGGATTAQAALMFQPLQGLSFRAAYSEAFKAPTLIQLFAGRTVLNNPFPDPKLGGVSVPVETVTGGNPRLQPETGKATSLTATWRRPDWHNLRISTTYFTVQQESRIVQVSPLSILGNEDILPGRVTRGAPAPGANIGPVTRIDATNLNFGGLKLSGLDVSASLDFPFGGGMLSPNVALTRTFKYTSQITLGTPYVDRLSNATTSDVWAPRYKATAGLTWRQGGFAATIQGRYVGRYLDYQTPVNTNHLGDYWTMDGSAEMSPADVPLIGSVAPEGFFARVSGTNLLDRGPKYSNYTSGVVGVDPTVDDVLGRTITVTLGKRF